MSTENLVKGHLPQFAYQLHLASGEVEKYVNDERSIRQFLQGMYGGRGPNGELVFVPEKGVLAENLPVVGESKLLHGKVSDDLFQSWSMVKTVVRRTGSSMRMAC
jgi:soluble epoxide hydrolase/lipid-phosphate phosphatase